MSKKEQIEWLFEASGGDEGKAFEINAGPVEMGMESKSEWPGTL